MKKGDSKSNPIQDQIKIMQQCPVCQGKYSTKQAKVVEERGEANLVHITCPHCSNSMIAVIVVSDLGMSSVGMLTDLNEEDVKRLRNKEIITEDELFGFHTLLKTNQFDFE